MYVRTYLLALDTHLRGLTYQVNECICFKIKCSGIVKVHPLIFKFQSKKCQTVRKVILPLVIGLPRKWSDKKLLVEVMLKIPNISN